MKEDSLSLSDTYSLSLSNSYSWLFETTTQQLLLAVGVLAVMGQCLFFVRVPSATEYETSVVTAYPLPFWIFFGVGLASVIFISLGSVTTASKYWQHALALLACNYGLFFTLPLARGYTMYGRGSDDTLYHLAAVKEILATGSLPDFLLYPLIHLLVSELVLAGLPLKVVRFVVPFLITMTFIGGIILITRELTGNQRALPAGLCAASPLMFGDFHIHIHPAMMSFLLFPIALFLVERIRKTESKAHVVLTLVFVLAIVFFHPITVLYLVALILSTVVFGYGYKWFNRSDIRKLRPILAIIAVCTGFTWYINFHRTQNAIIKMATGGTSAATNQVNRAGEAQLSTIEILMRFFQHYGAIFIYFMIAGLFFLIILYRIIRRRHKYGETYQAYQFAFGFLISMVFLFLLLSSKNPVRASRYMIVMAVILTAVFICQISNLTWTESTRRLIALAIGCSIVFAALLGAFATYQPNKHMTQAEYEGAEFMAKYTDGDPPVRSFELSKKMYRYVQSGTGIERRPKYGKNELNHQLFPRLGYDNNSTVEQSFGRSYLATQKHDTEHHNATYYTEAQQREQFFYGESDVERLHRDPTAHKIYANGGFRGWYVPGRLTD